MVKARGGDPRDATAPTPLGRSSTRAAAEVVADAGEARWVESHLRPLVGLGGGRRGARPRRGEAFAAWRPFFEALAERHRWCSSSRTCTGPTTALLDFVDELVDRAVGVPLLVVCTARPELLERRPGWGGGKRNAATVSLSPLSDEETTPARRACWRARCCRPGAGGAARARAGGNPLYAEEYVRMLGRGRAGDRAARELPLPETVQGIIAARLDALAPEEKASSRTRR